MYSGAGISTQHAIKKLVWRHKLKEIDQSSRSGRWSAAIFFWKKASSVTKIFNPFPCNRRPFLLLCFQNTFFLASWVFGGFLVLFFFWNWIRSMVLALDKETLVESIFHHMRDIRGKTSYLFLYMRKFLMCARFLLVWFCWTLCCKLLSNVLSTVSFSITKNSLVSLYFKRGDNLHLPNNKDKNERENCSDRKGCSQELLDKVMKER